MIGAVAIASRVLEPGEGCDPRPHLVQRKSRKYMGVQDDLAVCVAGDVWAQAGLAQRGVAAERVGLYLAVGFIPFREADIAPVLANSVDEAGAFSMARFAGGGYQRAHPLLAFRCLPNMPAFHVAVNFDIQGPYRVTYPSAGQTLLALEEACAALDDDRIDVALVIGVAHQRNFLVEHHHRSLDPPVAPERLRDAAAAVVLERDPAEPLAALAGLSTDYLPFDPLEALPTPVDEAHVDAQLVASGELELGPAAPLVHLAAFAAGDGDGLDVRVRGRDGVGGEVRWRRG